VAKKNILSVSQTDSLRKTRQLVLENAGYSVSSPTDLNEIEEVCKTIKFDVAVIGYTFEPSTKCTIADIIRKYCPTAPIVELTHGYPEIPDSVPSNPDAPELVATVQAILEETAGKQKNLS
jgi:DNA-binding response OmpR family regulator